MLNEPDLSTSRVIGEKTTQKKGPTVVFFGGIHGNEQAGTKALINVFQRLDESGMPLNGSFFGIRGNVPAYRAGQRFIEEDLNRIWTKKRIGQIEAKSPQELHPEEKELLEIKMVLDRILREHEGPFYFVDLHTTSSKTPPFITINDALINRRFSKLFGVPVVLGIEEFLVGPLLSYINELGYVSLGYEAGQHDSIQSIKNCESFIWKCLLFSGAISEESLPPISIKPTESVFFEVYHRHSILPENKFAMAPGFANFDHVKQGTLLATENGQEIRAQEDADLFMPLYQKQGEDGYFLIRKIPELAIRLSALLRRSKADGLLILLPGVRWSDAKKESLEVNTRIAKYFSKPLFHLLGYRQRSVNVDKIIMHNRERTAKTPMYRKLWWYRK